MDKKVLVAGAKLSGISASRLLARHGRKVILFDEGEKIKREDVESDLQGAENLENIEIYLGKFKDEFLEESDMLVLSPGVPVDVPFVKKAKEAGLKVIGEIELAYMYEKGVVAAITGTNGKTTTTTLVGEIIKAAYDEAYVVGNIGYPYADMADATSEKSVTVAEISSFQLETIDKFAPHVSAILNITPDHLNRHHTLENYAGCKLDITKNQTKNDYAVVNYDDPMLRTYIDKIPAKVVYFSRVEKLEQGVYLDNGRVTINTGDAVIDVLDIKDIQILGDHNIENVLAAVAVGYYMGVSTELIAEVCRSFKGVEHRIEYVRTVKGVRYYNDSKGTNPDAAIKAIKSMTTKTLLIGGGRDKALPYDDWILSFDGKVRYLVLIGEATPIIEECARKHGFDDIVKKESLEAAVQFCYENAQEGDTVLLSPACASWDMFKSYEQRGDMFKEYVAKLKE